MIILKKSHRRMVAVLAICVLCFSAFCATTSKAKAKAYWMTGTAGQSSLYYTGEKFDMSGEWGKGATLEKSAKVLWNNPKEVILINDYSSRYTRHANAFIDNSENCYGSYLRSRV